MKKLTLLIQLFTLFSTLSAQDQLPPPLEREITIHAENQTIETVLSDIAKQADIIFSYNPVALKYNNRVNLDVSEKSVRLALNLLFKGEVTYKVRGKYVILKKNSGSIDQKEGKRLYEGYVYDLNTGKTLTNVSVYNKRSMASTVTNKYGYFSMELPANTPLTSIRVSKLGYTDTLFTASLDDNSIRALEIYLDHSDSVHKKNNTKFRDLTNIAPLWLVSKNTLTNALNINDSIFRVVQFSLLPTVSTNHFLGGNVVNDVSVNLLAGYVQGVNVVEFGGLINIVRGNVRYAEFGGIGNIVGGNVTGVQAGGILNLANVVNGVQIAGIVNNTVGSASTQFSGFYNSCDKSSLQTAGFINIAQRSITQIAGFINLTKRSNLQIAGAINVTDTANVQIAGLINTTKGNCDVQVSGLINRADSVSLLQLSGLGNSTQGTANIQVAGLFNKARYIRKFQLSLINIADSNSGLPMGLFSFIKTGYHQLEISADEIFPFNLSFRSGTNYFHTLFAFGVSPFQKSGTFLDAGYGIGTSMGNSRKLLFDIDLTSKQIFHKNDFSFTHNLLQLYTGIDKALWSGCSIAMGVTYNYLFYKNADTNATYLSLPPYSFATHTFSNGLAFKSWIGGKIALRFF